MLVLSQGEAATLAAWFWVCVVETLPYVTVTYICRRLCSESLLL